MNAIFYKINMYVDDYSYRIFQEISRDIKSGLNFNSIFKQINSSTGNLIDYNIRVIVYNCSALGVIVQLAMLSLGMNLTVGITFIGALLLIRYHVKGKLNDFWYQRATAIANENSAAFINKAAKLCNWVADNPNGDASSKEGSITGKDWGAFGLFKTVTPINELLSTLKREAGLRGSEEDLKKILSNLPASTTLFLTLLKIFTFMQGESASNLSVSIRRIGQLP